MCGGGGGRWVEGRVTSEADSLSRTDVVYM